MKRVNFPRSFVLRPQGYIRRVTRLLKQTVAPLCYKGKTKPISSAWWRNRVDVYPCGGVHRPPTSFRRLIVATTLGLGVFIWEKKRHVAAFAAFRTLTHGAGGQRTRGHMLHFSRGCSRQLGLLTHFSPSCVRLYFESVVVLSGATSCAGQLCFAQWTRNLLSESERR